MTLDEVRALVIAIDPDATHYYSESKADSYTTWHEYRREPLYGDNADAETVWKFQVDHFTKSEDDPMKDDIWNGLSSDDRITVAHLVFFERDSGYIHHVYQCEGV